LPGELEGLSVDDFHVGSAAGPGRETERDLEVDSEGKMQHELARESRGLLPAGCEGDCRRDCEGGLRTDLQSCPQGETAGIVPSSRQSWDADFVLQVFTLWILFYSVYGSASSAQAADYPGGSGDLCGPDDG
jgi:hypothetical protein